MENNLCLTSIIELPPTIIHKISKLLRRLEAVKESSNTHIYKPENLHITLLGLISIWDDINITQQEKRTLHDLYKSAIGEVRSPVVLQFDGYGTTSSSLLLKIRDTNGMLNKLRKRIIDEIKDSALTFNESHLQSFDLGFAWCTIVRTQNADRLINETMAFEDASIGSFEVKNVHIVVTDKNYLMENTQQLFSFSIGQPNI